MTSSEYNTLTRELLGRVNNAPVRVLVDGEELVCRRDTVLCWALGCHSVGGDCIYCEVRPDASGAYVCSGQEIRRFQVYPLATFPGHLVYHGRVAKNIRPPKEWARERKV